MAEKSALFEAVQLGNGGVTLSHRIVLAPLTRNRATEPSLCPHDLHRDYYSQRASPGGLLISEAVCISPEAMGYLSVPGIWSDEQVRAWRPVTAAVHAKGGRIFCQLWHTGRIAQPSFGEHPLLRRTGRPLPSVSASAVRMVHPKTGKPLPAETYKGAEESATPRALATSEIPRLVEDYAQAARNAVAAGFDGVEVHGAHGYLIDQFLQNGVNRRADEYGGSVENRCRLLGEVVQAVTRAVGPGRVSVRLSPTTVDPRTGRQNQLYFAASTSDPDAVYEHAVRSMNAFPLAYLLLTEPRWSGRSDHDITQDKGFDKPLTNVKYREISRHILVAAGGFTPASAAAALEAKQYDMIAFGRWFLSNPDLPERIRTGAPLNVYDRATFYTASFQGGGGEGYVDYPSLDGSVGVVGKYPTVEQGVIGATLPRSSKL